MPSPSKTPRQLDIYGKEVPYQNVVKPQRYWVFYPRSIPPAFKPRTRDDRAAGREAEKYPVEQWAKRILWGKDGPFDSLTEAQESAKLAITQAKSFWAGVWTTARRGDTKPIFIARWAGSRQRDAMEATEMAREGTGDTEATLQP